MLIRDERGMTVVELLVTMISVIVVLSAITTITTAALSSQDRITDRVSVNQRARPVMTRIIDALHSSCVAQRVAPVLAGSTGTSISFLSKNGSAVTPTPDRRVISLSGTSLVEQVYPATGGQPPVWTFSSTPSQTRTLMTNVAAPGTGQPVFSYYDYVTGRLNTTPLPTPLSTTNAARAAYVTVSFRVNPSGVSQDAKAHLTINDAADLRLESAGQFPAQENLPCM